MKLKDKTMKEFLENNAYFVDFFNAYFFDGERVLKSENCIELDSEMNDANMELEKHVDVIRKYNDGNLYSAFIIENQSSSRRPMIITTNLKLSELKNPPDLAHARIYDRILERCAPILFAGKNFREENEIVSFCSVCLVYHTLWQLSMRICENVEKS